MSDFELYVNEYKKKYQQYSEETQSWESFSISMNLMEWIGYYLFEWSAAPYDRFIFDVSKLNIPIHMSVRVDPILKILTHIEGGQDDI